MHWNLVRTMNRDFRLVKGSVRKFCSVLFNLGSNCTLFLGQEFVIYKDQGISPDRDKVFPLT